MGMDKRTNGFNSALQDAQSLAAGRDHQFVEPAHVLLAMLDAQSASVRPLIAKAGGDVARLKTALVETLERLPRVEGNAGQIEPSRSLINLLNVCDKLAQQRGDEYISSEVFVLAGFEDRNTLARLYKEVRLQKAALEKAIEEVRGGDKVNDAGAEEKRGALEKY